MHFLRKTKTSASNSGTYMSRKFSDLHKCYVHLSYHIWSPPGLISPLRILMLRCPDLLPTTDDVLHRDMCVHMTPLCNHHYCRRQQRLRQLRFCTMNSGMLVCSTRDSSLRIKEHNCLHKWIITAIVTSEKTKQFLCSSHSNSLFRSFLTLGRLICLVFLT